MSCHRKVTHYRDGFGVKNKWTETCGLLSLLHLGLLFCHINIRTGPHYTRLLCPGGSAGSAPRSWPWPGPPRTRCPLCQRALPGTLLSSTLSALALPSPGEAQLSLW